MKGIEYRGVTSVDGPIVVLKRTENVFYNEQFVFAIEQAKNVLVRLLIFLIQLL